VVLREPQGGDRNGEAAGFTPYAVSLQMRCTTCGGRGPPLRVEVAGMGPDSPLPQPRGLTNELPGSRRNWR
jgi:hypothetical protein